MQIQNLDNTHSHSMHQVTSCMHDHGESDAKIGGMRMQTSSQREQTNALETITEGQLSLLNVVKNHVLNGTKLFSKVWGDSDSKGTDATVTTRNDNEFTSQKQVLAQNNPYFTAVENRSIANPPIREKIRARLQDWKQNKNRQQTKKDLRKHSRYRKDGIEIDCILTDDSYLLDSYDRNGEYSTLSTKK